MYTLSDELGEDEQWDGERGFIHLSVDKYLEPGVRGLVKLSASPTAISLQSLAWIAPLSSPPSAHCEHEHNASMHALWLLTHLRSL